jgi:hypothetical protein
LSERKRNLFIAFDYDETASCNSIFNASQFLADVDDVIIACKSILSAEVASSLMSIQSSNPDFFANFTAIRTEIYRSYSPFLSQWPQTFWMLHKVSEECASLLQR